MDLGAELEVFNLGGDEPDLEPWGQVKCLLFLRCRQRFCRPDVRAQRIIGSGARGTRKKDAEHKAVRARIVVQASRLLSVVGRSPYRPTGRDIVWVGGSGGPPTTQDTRKKHRSDYKLKADSFSNHQPNCFRMLALLDDATHDGGALVSEAFHLLEAPLGAIGGNAGQESSCRLRVVDQRVA